MPELPEVESVRQGLEKLTVGKHIKDVTVRVPKMVHHDLEDFKYCLIGQSITSVGRRGKYLIFHIGNQVLISHLRMEGKYLLFEGDVLENKHFHVFFHFTDGSTLVYQDVRKFGTFELMSDEDLTSFFDKKKLGPEPVLSDFNLNIFKEGLKKSRKPIKTLLLEQRLVVGLGNIYVDEVLWASKIHPTRPSNLIKPKEASLLHQEIIRILALAVEKGGSSIRTYKNALGKDGEMQHYLKVYGKTGQTCERCGKTIEKIKLGGRGTHFCPNCQK